MLYSNTEQQARAALSNLYINPGTLCSWGVITAMEFGLAITGEGRACCRCGCKPDLALAPLVLMQAPSLAFPRLDTPQPQA
jgi:hypothetical protein